MNDIKVSQEAREAAQTLLRSMGRGLFKEHSEVASEAFARFEAQIVERCAKVADAEAAKCIPLMNGFGVSANIEIGRHRQATEIATAIRTGGQS